MKVTRESIGTAYLYDTSVENIFINEYLPMAPEGYVKVYLLAKMYMHSGVDLSLETLAKTLHVTEEAVDKALAYWERNGLIKRIAGELVFVSAKEKLYGSSRDKAQTLPEESDAILENEQLARLVQRLQPLMGTEISGTEVQQMLWWMQEYNATEDLIFGAVEYCFKRGKRNLKYVGKVVADWAGKGILTSDDVEEFLQEHGQRHYAYKRVMRALGFSRNATEKERDIVDKWFDEMDCTMEDVLTACNKTSGISNPNLNYVNAVLRGKKGRDEEGNLKVSTQTMQEYYRHLREKAEAAAKARRVEVMRTLPQLAEIEEHLLACNKELMNAMIVGGANKAQQVDAIQKKMQSLEDHRDRLLTERGIPLGYDNVQYTCPKCQDTGILQDGSRCSCWEDRKKEASAWQQEK